MKREFLLNFKVGDQPLTKEIIDEIMAENGRDIQKAKAGFADYDQLKQDLETANQKVKDLEAQDPDGLRRQAQEWEEKYNTAVEDHKKELEAIEFQRTLDTAISGAKGRNAKAITALLDVDTLKNSETQADAINAALEELKKSSGYLFDDGAAPPPYSAGAGGPAKNPPASTGSLADALREKFNTK